MVTLIVQLPSALASVYCLAVQPTILLFQATFQLWQKAVFKQKALKTYLLTITLQSDALSDQLVIAVEHLAVKEPGTSFRSGSRPKTDGEGINLRLTFSRWPKRQKLQRNANFAS